MAASESRLTFITESLPGFTVGVPQQFTLEASGGRPPYRFQVTQGALPAALNLSQAGTISGAVTKAVPDTTVFVQLTDADRSQLTQAFDVQVSY
jgi:hypothetical protein